MQLSELFTNLSYGVLSNLSVGGEGSGVIPDAKHAALITHTNSGLKALHSRFPLIEKEVIVRTYVGITEDRLLKIYADQDPSVVDQKYIADTVSAPFLGDVMKILEVYNVEGERLPLNEPMEVNSLFTPYFDTLHILSPETTGDLHVLYWAGPAHLDPGNVNGPADLTQNFELPPVLVPALEAWIGHKVYAAMAGAEMSAKAIAQLQIYDRICNDVEARDLVTSSLTGERTKLDDRGFA